MHLSALGHAWVLRVLRNNTVKSFHVFKCMTHDYWIVHAFAIIRKNSYFCLGICHGTEFCHLSTVQPNRNGAYRINGIDLESF